MENQTTETQKQVVATVFNPDTKFVLTVQELAIIERALQPLVWANSIIQNAKNTAASQGAVQNTYIEDYKKNPDGSFVIENGNYVLVDDFWDRFKQSEVVK